MLFTSDERAPYRPKESPDATSEKFGIKQPIGARNKVRNRHAVGGKTIPLESVIGELNHNEAIHCLSLGNWSMHNLIEYVLLQTGPADVQIMTWSIKNAAVQSLLQLREQGQILELTCVFDNRVKAMCPEAWQLAENNIDCRLTKNHSKVTIIKTPDWSISIVASANMTYNPRIEAYVITEDLPTANYYGQLIDQLAAGAKPFHHAQ